MKMSQWGQNNNDMKQQRPIDRQRDGAITLTVGDEEDSSPIISHLSTCNALYVIKQKSVFKVQTADNIDPERINPNIPNLSQRVLSAGNDNEIVARILLTAKCLFDEKNATVRPFIGALFEQSIDLTRHVLALYDMIADLREKIIQKEKAFEGREHKPNAFSLPSVPDLDKDLHNILVKADKAKDSILSIYRLHFFPEYKKKPTLEEYDTAIHDKLTSEPDIVEAWSNTKAVLNLMRNIRNASEHRRDGNQLKVKDFEMQPDGSVNSPVMEIEHKDTPIESVQVVKFLDFIGKIVLDCAESSLVIIRSAVLLDKNPFNEQVSFIPTENRRHPLVRFYRTINMNGEIRILG